MFRELLRMVRCLFGKHPAGRRWPIRYVDRRATVWICLACDRWAGIDEWDAA